MQLIIYLLIDLLKLNRSNKLINSRILNGGVQNKKLLEPFKTINNIMSEINAISKDEVVSYIDYLLN